MHRAAVSANSNFRKNLGDTPLTAAFFSICGTIIPHAAMLVLRPQMPGMSALRETPWLELDRRPSRAAIVLAGATLVQELGAALFIALVVGGQLLCSLLLDHFGLMGACAAINHPGRVIGALFVLAGVMCIKYL